jgi:DNA polymerase III epsilon subunit-like protein
MEEDANGYRYMPEATWGPDKVLNLFPSQENRQSTDRTPNFGFIDKGPVITPEQYVQKMENEPRIRMSKYKINSRTGEPIEDTEVEFDRMRFGKTFDINPDVSDEISESVSEEIQEKSLGRSLKERMPGGSLIGRAAARFGVIMDELGKMRCPPGTPAANQFTDMTGSNCFGTSPGTLISEAINLAQNLVPEDDSRRSSRLTRGIVNLMFDLENGLFGNNVWYHADGTRMKHGEWRKFREAGGVAKNERWMVNGVERVLAELDSQDARMEDLYSKLGIDVSDVRKATNEDVFEAFQKLKDSGVIRAQLRGRPSAAQVEAMMTARLQNMDAHWIARSAEERKILLDIEVKRYRELERAHMEAFLDEVIKNPEHMKTIGDVTFNPAGRDRASFGISRIGPDGKPVGSINIDIPMSLKFQDSMLPNLSPDERLRIWAEGGQSEVLRAMAVKDFLVNSNSHAGQMIAMVDGGRGLGRHDMKHEIAHSIQAVAIFNHMKRELDARGSLVIDNGENKAPTVITDVSQLNSDMLMALMARENFMGIDLNSLKDLRSRGDVVAFLAGKYIDEVQAQYGGMRRAAEIGAELWSLRSSGLIYGDDVDAALEYMDDVASGAITIDRTVSDEILNRRVYEEYLDGSRRIREAREESERLAEEAEDGEFFDAEGRASAERLSAAREAYAAEKRAEVKEVKEAAKTMSEEDMIDFLADATESSDVLTEMLDSVEEAGEEPDWMSVMDRDTLDAMSKAVVDEWVKRFTVRRSPEAMEKLQKMIDDKRESKGTLSPEKVEERRFRQFMEGAAERAQEMGLEDLVQAYSDWEELATGEGVDGVDRARRKEMRDMYRDEYIKRRTEGPDSVSKEDARKEFNSKFKTLRKPKTTAAREREKRANPKKFKTHNGKDGARTFATAERERLLEGATTEEKIALVEMGSGETDVINMMNGSSEGMASARAIQRRNTRLKKNGVLPDELNHHEASIEEQVENFYIPLLELMDKSSLSQTVEMHIDSNDDAMKYVEDLLNGGSPEFTVGIGTGTLVTSNTDFSDGKKIVIRVPEGSRAVFPDWSFYSDSDNGEQKMMIPPSKFHLVEIRDDGTVVLEVGEQKGTEEVLKDAIEEISPSAGDSDFAYREGLKKKVGRVVDKRIAERRRQGMFDPEKRSPVEEERFSASADNAAAAAGFEPDLPPPPTGDSPNKQRGVKRRQASAAIDRVVNPNNRTEDSWQKERRARQELDAIHAYITGEGAYQNRTNRVGRKIAQMMEEAFGTSNINELTEDQKYDLIDLISQRLDAKLRIDNNGSYDDRRSLSQFKSRIQDHIDISKMLDSNDFSDPYGSDGYDIDWSSIDTTPDRPERFSSGAKWGQMPSSNEQIDGLLDASNNDGFNEIYGSPQTREERIAQMVEMQSEVLTSLREMIDNVPGSGDELGLEASSIDPVIMDLIKNSSDEEIYQIISKAAMDLHQSFDSRPRVRMRQDELDNFLKTGRYGRESSFDTDANRFSSGRISKGIRARAKDKAIEMIAERIGKDEDSREIAEMVLDTVSALKYGPEAALTRLAIDLGRRGSRDIAERTLEELVSRGKLTDEQAKSILSKMDRFAPDGLPEPIKRGVGSAVRAAADAIDTPENRERLDRAREAAGEAAGRAREAVGEGARNVAERGRERLRRLRERDDRGEIPSSPEDVPFGDFDPADTIFSSGRRLDRRVASSEAGRERIMDGAKKTRTRFSSGETPELKEPKKPSRPREPDNGPMTGKFIDIFKGVKSYKEMLDRYNEQEVIFFDYETTGFDPKVERPVQIGAVKMKGGKVVERFNIFVNPEKELSDWSKANLVDADGNPLTNDWLNNQPSIAEAHQQLIDFFGPDALLGGQFTPFDLGFLEESLKNAGIEWTPAGVIDSKALADELLPKWTPETGDGPFALNDDGSKYATNSLGPLSEYLGVDLKAWHTADADSEASAMIVQKILERAAERDDTPKHLLKVENMPAIVNERRAKHKLAMDKYFADMKQYKADMEAYNASKSDSGGGTRFSSGGKADPMVIKTNGRYGDTSGKSDFSSDELKTIDEITERLSNSDLNLAWFSLENEDGTATSSPLINFNGRPIAVVRIGEQNIPFYRSTGSGGKDPSRFVPNKWYPFWGYNASGQWFIKNEEMENYYGIPELEEISKQLDTLTDGLPKLKASTEWRSVANIETGQMDDDFRGLINGTAFRNADSLYNRRDITNHITVSKKKTRDEIKLMKRDALKASRDGNTPPGVDRFSSGETYRELVRTEGRPSEKQKEAISDVKDILRNNEFGIADEFDDEYEVVDSPRRAELKAKVAEKISEAFSHDIEAREDVVVTAKNGEKINLGKDFKIEISEISVDVDTYDEETLEAIKEQQFYDTPTGSMSDSPSTLISMKISIKPKDEEAAKRLEQAGIPELLLPDYFDGTPGADDVRVGFSSRNLVINGNEMHATHESLFLRDEAQGKGIGSLFNAKNEGVYEELGVRRILTNGQSSELGESEGGTHWPRNGFTWAGEQSKQDFIKVIDRALKRRKSKFSEEEYARISSLYRKNPSTRKFETDASAEELVDFAYADELFKEQDASFMFKRDIELVSAGSPRFSSGGTRFSSGASGAARAGINRDIYEREGGRPSDKLEPSSLLRKSSDGKDSSALEINGKTYDIKSLKNEDGNFSVFIENEDGKKIAEIVLNQEPTSYASIVSISSEEDAQKAGALEGILDSLLINNPDATFRKTEKTAEWFNYVTNGMADYGLQGSRQVGFSGKFSDGERATPDGDYTLSSFLRFKPKRNSSKTLKSDKNSFSEYSYKWNGEIFDIGGESLVFGAPEDAEFEDSSIKKINLNPFEILGLEPTSEEGRDAAMKWMSAIHGASISIISDGQEFKPSTYVSALLYASSKGDKKAAEELDALAKRSSDWLAKLKEKEQKIEETGNALPLNSRLVHQTSYKPTIDKDGYLVLRPLEDFPQKSNDGSDVTVNRTTLHLAINHLAEGHMFRQETQGKSYIVMMPLDSFMDQNPDSLENLSIVDTAATPPPGDGLRMAPGTFKVIEVDEGGNGRRMVEDALREDGVGVLVGGDRSSGTPGADKAAEARARMLGVSNNVASDLPLTVFETINRTSIYEQSRYADVPATTEIMQTASKNTLMRMANRRENAWTAFDKEVVATDFLSSGEVKAPAEPRTRKPKRVKKYKGYDLNEPDNPAPKPGEFPDDVVEAATKHRAEIEKVEAEITKLLIDLAEKNKARMEGLDFRLKALKSLMRKIAAEKDSEHGGDAEKAAKSMSDVVRYTMSYGPEDYVAGVKDVVAEMQKLGYDLRIKNYWKGGDPYQGINVAVTHPDGTKFELQFHTPQSVAEKEKIHVMYEEYRTSKDPGQRWELYQRMVEIANQIGVPIPPEELLTIGQVKEQPFQAE